MKLQILTLMLALLTFNTSAQYKRSLNIGLPRLDPFTKSILQKQSPATVRKGTGIGNRLIGWSLREGNFVRDSTRFKYANGRGSRLDNNFPYDSYLETMYDPTIIVSDAEPGSLNRDMPNLLFDSAVTTSISSTSNSYDFTYRLYSGNIIKQFTDNVFIYAGNTFHTKSKYEFVYNQNGMLTAGRAYADTTSNSTGNYSLLREITSEYNGNKIILDTSVIIPYSTRYSYDFSGNLIHIICRDASSTWSENTFIYNSNGQLSTHLYHNGTHNIWIDSFKYTGNNLTYSSFYSWNDTFNIWNNGTVWTYHYNTSNNQDSVLTNSVTSGGLSPAQLTVYTYTPFGYYDKVKTYLYNGTSLNTTPDYEWRFYYETYTTGINYIKKQADLAAVFPIPANNILNVIMKSTAGNSPVRFRIFNAQGQLLLEMQNAPAVSYSLPVSELSPGRYIVEIANETERQSITFIKR